MFGECKGLTSITLPDTLTTVGDGVFYHCDGLTSLALPGTFTCVSNSMFEGCLGLTSITLPDTLTRVGRCAFYSCRGLTSLTLPHALRFFNCNAFAYCTGLISVVFRPPVSQRAFIAWAVGSSRNRANWQLTTLKRLLNVLKLIAVFVLERRDVSTVYDKEEDTVFEGCTRLKKLCDKDYQGGPTRMYGTRSSTKRTRSQTSHTLFDNNALDKLPRGLVFLNKFTSYRLVRTRCIIETLVLGLFYLLSFFFLQRRSSVTKMPTRMTRGRTRMTVRVSDDHHTPDPRTLPSTHTRARTHTHTHTHARTTH